MPFFDSTEQLQAVFEDFWERAKQETEVMEKLARSKVVVRFDIEQPEIHVTINFLDTDPDGNHGTICTGFFYGLFGRIKNRDIMNDLPALAWSHTGNHAGPIFQHLLGMKRPIASGNSLDKDFRILV